MSWWLEGRRFYSPFFPVWVKSTRCYCLERGNRYSYFKQAWGEWSRWEWKRPANHPRVQSTCCEETGSDVRQVLVCHGEKVCSTDQLQWCFCVLKPGNSESECNPPVERLFRFLSPSFLHLMQTPSILWTDLAPMLCPLVKALCSTAYFPCLCGDWDWFLPTHEEKVAFGYVAAVGYAIVQGLAWESFSCSCDLNLTRCCTGGIPLTGLPLCLLCKYGPGELTFLVFRVAFRTLLLNHSCGLHS